MNEIVNNIAVTLALDILEPAAKQLGKTLELPFRFINVLLSSPELYIYEREINVARIKEIMLEKSKDFDLDKIKEPKPYVAIPALQAMSYCMDDESLRNMYANLLLNAMHEDFQDKVHPAFVEIIKQMAPIDAIILSSFSKMQLRPCVNYIIEFMGAKSPAIRNVVLGNHEIKNMELVSASMDNLIRLGLVTVDFTNKIVGDDNLIYSEFLETSYCKKYFDDDSKGKCSIDIHRGLSQITTMGYNFKRLCL